MQVFTLFPTSKILWIIFQGDLNNFLPSFILFLYVFQMVLGIFVYIDHHQLRMVSIGVLENHDVYQLKTPFTLTHFYFFPLLFLTFGPYYSSTSTFLLSFIFCHQGFSSCFTSGLTSGFTTSTFFTSSLGSGVPRVGNISFIFFW